MVYRLRGMVQVQPFPEMVDAVKCVRAEGLKTALLTNNWFTDEQKSVSLVPMDTSLFDVVGISIFKRCSRAVTNDSHMTWCVQK